MPGDEEDRKKAIRLLRKKEFWEQEKVSLANERIETGMSDASSCKSCRSLTLRSIGTNA